MAEMTSLNGRKADVPEIGICKAHRKDTVCFSCTSRKMVIAVSSSVFLSVLIAVVVTITVLAEGKEPNPKPLRIGAFNIRKFGKSKMSNNRTANFINTILQRYDVILVLEVMDISQVSLDSLLLILQTRDKSWKYVSSDRLGRTRYKEQYVFYYKSKSVTVEGQYQVPDDEFDVFEREPFAINIKYTSVSAREPRQVALAGIHIKPSDALAELKELPAAVEHIANAFSDIDGVIVMGDYNADCSYLGKKNQKTLSIFSSNKYRNLISNTMDTTVAKGDCAYDRVTVYGDKIDTRDAKVYRFDEEMKLNITETLSVSDHYPVEFLLY